MAANSTSLMLMAKARRRRAEAEASAAAQPDYIGAAMRSNPLTAGIEAGFNALGTSTGGMVSQGMSGVNRGLAHTLDLPKAALSIGPELMNAIFHTDFKGPDYIPDIGSQVEGGMAKVGMVKPPSSNVAERLAESAGESMGASVLPEVGLTAKAGGTFMDVLRGMFPAATSGLAGGTAQEVAPGNEGARVAAELLGGIVPSTALSGVRALTRPAAIQADGTPVPRIVTDAIKRDQVPLDQVGQQVADLGDAGVVADLGDNTQKLTMGLAAKPTAAGSSITNAMKERSKASTDRVPAAVNDILGPVAEPTQIKNDIRANKDVVGPEYDITKTTPSPVDPRPIANALDTAIDNSAGEAQSALQSIRNSMNVRSTGELSADPDKLLQVRQAIDGIVGSTQDSNVQRVLGKVRDQIDATLTQMFPDIKSTDAKYQELSRQGRGLDEGSKVLSKTVRPYDNAINIAEGVQPAGELVGPSAATFRLSQGARTEVDSIIGNNLNDRAKLTDLMKAPSDWNYQKLSQLFGEDKAAALLKVVQNERQMAETENMAVHGSKTGASIAAQEALDANPAKPLTDVVRNSGFSPGFGVTTAAAGLTDTISRAIFRGRNERAANALLSRGDWTSTAGDPFMTPEQRNAIISAVFGTMANGAAR